MKQFSKEITDILKKIGVEDQSRVAEVPKSRSAGNPGDVVFFIYKHKNKQRRSRFLLLTRPIIKNAKTGNTLLTGLSLPEMPDEQSINLFKAIVYLYNQRVKLTKLEKLKEDSNLESDIKKEVQKQKLIDRYKKKYLDSKYRTFITDNMVGCLYRLDIR